MERGGGYFQTYKSRDKIMETLATRTVVGLLLMDKHDKHGAMLRESNHSRQMSEFSKRI